MSRERTYCASIRNSMTSSWPMCANPTGQFGAHFYRVVKRPKASIIIIIAVKQS